LSTQSFHHISKQLKDAIFAAGGGIYAEGKYVQVASRFLDLVNSYLWQKLVQCITQGRPGSWRGWRRSEITCTGKDVTRAAVAALKK
jgi:hypothetical protein